MNAFSGNQFGDVSALLRALGMVSEDGEFVGDWVKNPDRYLRTILADSGQREALIAFAATARSGTLDSDAVGRSWIEILSETVRDLGLVRFYLVMDDSPDEEVRLFLGLRLDAGSPTLCRASMLFPLFRAAKNVAGAPTTPDLVGTAGGVIEFTADFILSGDTPAAGEAALAGLGLTVSLPTDPTDPTPNVGLSLSGLQLPGEISPRDLSLSLTDGGQLVDTAIDLILALLQAQVNANAGDEIAALAKVLGLDSSTGIPAFPITDLVTRGVDALSDWLAQTIGSTAARTAWLTALAELIGNSASATAEGIDLPLGSGAVRIGLDAQTGSAGKPVVTLSVGMGYTDPTADVRLTAKLVRLDLSTGEAVALPDLRAELSFDVGLSTADFEVDRLALGFGLDPARKPVLLLELRNARVFTTSYTTLDLANPDALAAAATQAVGDALTQILGQLGPAATRVSVALGWSAPTGASASYPTVNVISFLGDPLGSLRSHWQAVLGSHAADMPLVLTALRELVTGTTGAVSGSGTHANPWLIPLETTSQFAIAVWRDADGRLLFGVSLRFRVDDLGERCTVVETRLRAGLAAIDLGSGETSFLPEIRLSAFGRARGGGRLQLAADELRLEVDRLGVLARWSPDTPLSVGLDAPDPALYLDNIALPLDIPDFSGGFDGFFASLTETQWTALERIGAMLALRVETNWLRELIAMFHWLPDPPALGSQSPFRLSLKGLFDDPELELKRWFVQLIIGLGDGLNVALQPLGRLLSGDPLADTLVSGSGTIEAPYLLRLSGDPARPSLALWLEPDGPIARPDFAASTPLRSWRPGTPGLSAASLSAAIFSEFPDFDGLPGPETISAEILSDGLSAIADLWDGTDGHCPPPAAPIAGVTTHVVPNTPAATIFAAADAATYLGAAAPDTLVLISTLPETAVVPTLNPAPAQVLDLREPGRDPLAFSALPGAAGRYHVLLAPRADARLAGGDPSGILGQVARLRQAMAPLAGRPGATVMADAAAGHAAWMALDQMGAGIDRLIVVGTPLEAAQVPAAPATSVKEALARLAELLPTEDVAEPDDAQLARARSLLDGWAGRGAADLSDLQLPPAWDRTKRASLSVHAVYGVMSVAEVDAALTAVVAAGLSLRGQVRAARRAVQSIDGAGMGLHLPLATTATAGALSVAGHVLAEIVGTDIDTSGSVPAPRQRGAKRVLGQLEVRRSGGWLIGGPGTSPRPGLELRKIELHGQFAYGGSTTQPDRLRMTLHGVRVADIAYPRLEIDADVAQGDLGIDGLAAPSTPEIAQMLSQVMGEIDSSTDPTVATLAKLLRGAGILGGGGSFDPLSLSRWTDNPAARLSDALANSALRSHLLQAIEDFLTANAALSYAPVTRQLTVNMTGSTGETLFQDWAIAATLGPGGLSSGSFRLGQAAGVNLAADFAPSLGLTLNSGGARDGLPADLSLWPLADISPILPSLPPLGLSFVLSQSLEALRHADASARPVVDAALVAFGMLDPATPGAKVQIPPLAFLDPAAWLGSSGVLGQSGGSGLSLRADKVIALLDALKPLTGATGPGGTWAMIPGLALRARDASGLVLEVQIDASAFQTGSDIAFGGTFGLHFPSGLTPRPSVASFAGLRGGSAGTRAVHVTLSGTDLRVFLRPASGGDLGIYPNLSGLADVGLATVVNALPAALDAIVDDGSTVGTVLADIGDALLLRTTAPIPRFDATAISAWATDPSAALAARWPQLLSSGLAQLGSLMPAGMTLTRPASGVNPASGVKLTLNNVATPSSNIAVTLEPAPFRVVIETSQRGLPFLVNADATIAFDTAGLDRLNCTLGPAQIPVGDGIVLRPVLDLDVGNAAAAANQVGFGLSMESALTSERLRLAYDFDAPSGFELSFGGSTSPGNVAAGLMHVAIDLLGAFVVDLPAVENVLGLDIGTKTLEDVLKGVILRTSGKLDPEFFQVIPIGSQTAQSLFDDKLDRVFTLIQNLSRAGVALDLGPIKIGLGGPDAGVLPAASGTILGLRVELTGRYALLSGDVALWIENDNRWIIDSPGAGLFIGFFDTTSRDFAPLLRVDGVGLRVGRTSAPLLTDPIGLGSVALHILAQIGGAQPLGGAQVQLSEISVAVGGASGGNPVAQGMLSETNDGTAPLAPAFSPALSLQTRPGGSGDLALRFRAGDGEGPWWLPIRRQFGPLYVDQIGMGTQEENDQLKSISLLFDGGVSIAGLAAAVDDLELRHDVTKGDFFDSEAWDVDLAGLSVSANLSGVTLAGGLRKFTEGDPPTLYEYIGMLNARFAAYGLSIYGGYARTDAYTAFFAFGAVLGPFGGPPAFFLTGIGGGLGINREIVPPSNVGEFNEFPMLAALDPQASVPADLMDYMADIRAAFPASQGRFWFAAGISFTSFALVDGIAVVAVEFGDGFELTIFGLARMALPRPEVALVSIELGLIARFSTSEGVLWIQAQLTDNSWLFHPSARLTGGFAFVSWFGGPNRGQFVLTLGGYHPSFKADGYPVVPRLGWNWSPISNITIKSESYYALTSEAMMAGGLFEASAKYGPAYAHLSFGGNAIIYFDPFRYQADAHARVSAGIRIKTFLGTIKLSFTLGAWIEVSGPEFRGRAGIEIGPIDITVRFGGNDIPPPSIDWVEFATKYLELATGSSARAVATVAGKGALPPASSSGEEPGTADGSAAHPFDVLSEFELSLTTTIPITQVERGSIGISVPPIDTLGLAPMDKPLRKSVLTLSLRKNGTGDEELDHTSQITVTPRQTGAFPKGVWGEAPSGQKVPKGQVIAATEGVDFVFLAKGTGRIPAASTGGIAFNQVEAGPRKPLPLRPVGALSRSMTQEGQTQRLALAGLATARMSEISDTWRMVPKREATSARASFRERFTPMRVGLLSERIVRSIDRGRKNVIRSDRVSTGPLIYEQPRLTGVLTMPTRPADRLRETTSVTRFDDVVANLPRTRPPGLGTPLATANAGIQAPLVRADLGLAAAEPAKTLRARHATPPTVALRASAGAAGMRAGSANRDTLASVAAMVSDGDRRQRRRSGGTRALAPGELAVFDMPGSARAARFDNAGLLQLKGRARVIVLDAYGAILENATLSGGRRTLPKNAALVAILAGDSGAADGQAVRGWTAGTRLAYLGRSMARCAGGFVRAPGASRTRGGRRASVGWMRAADLTDQAALVETRFDAAATSVALIIDGVVTETDLASLTLGFEGAETDGGDPLLVPFDGKTLIVHELARGTKAFGAHVGGLTAGRLDGVLAADLSPDRLVSRIVSETATPVLDLATDTNAEPVEITWSKPADIPAEELK